MRVMLHCFVLVVNKGVNMFYVASNKLAYAMQTGFAVPKNGIVYGVFASAASAANYLQSTKRGLVAQIVYLP